MRLLDGLRRWRERIMTSPAFRRRAAAFPLTRPIARRRTRQLFDLCAGFVYSQVLQSCVETGLFRMLAARPRSILELAPLVGLTPEATDRLIVAAVGLRLAEYRGALVALGPLGTAMIDNPGVEAMIVHHRRLYRDLEDPVALLRDPQRATSLSTYWPYATAGNPHALAADALADYSRLMAASQGMIAADIIAAYPFARHRQILDIGGGNGSFLAAVGAACPFLRLQLFDLPGVADLARHHLEASGLAARSDIVDGDFKADALPAGADLVTLIRVLHDHSDETVQALLRRVHTALPPGGTVLVAEPMAGTRGAESVGAYFSFYLLAMRSGQPRTAERICRLLSLAGFARPTLHRTATPLLVRAISARKATSPSGVNPA